MSTRILAPAARIAGCRSSHRSTSARDPALWRFAPLLVPDEFELHDLTHAANERVPVEAIATGADIVYNPLGGYPGRVTAAEQNQVH